MTAFLLQLWYGDSPLKWLLWPAAFLFNQVSRIRRWYLQKYAATEHPVPIIVVGNITVGGVGKTPLVITLANALKDKGLRVGIVSRGYGAAVKDFPYLVQQRDSATLVGDEPLLLAQKTDCPVVIAPKRNAAVDYLLEHCHSQVIISDDGLQHYRMGRAIEIAVIDGQRGLGNGLSLPAGPLREPARRLEEVDFLLCNDGDWPLAHPLQLVSAPIRQLATEREVAKETLPTPLVALAGIGNPQRFYQSLEQLDLQFERYSYPDHYQFTPNDLNYPHSTIIMTEKDAVKCRAFNQDNVYYLPVDAVVPTAFWDAFWSHPQLRLLLL